MLMPFRFVSNLRPQSVPSFERVGHRPQAWLLSSHRLDSATEALARMEAWQPPLLKQWMSPDAA